MVVHLVLHCCTLQVLPIKSYIGDMEDLPYAASWDREHVSKCMPTTWGGYSKRKTSFGKADLRVFSIIVETSYDKTPSANSLGKYKRVLNPYSVNNGHVPQNIRVSLLLAEFAEPYVRILSVNGQAHTRDIVPLQDRSG
jgi:hypothetical protein